MASVRSHPVAGAAVGAVFAVVALILVLVGSLEDLAGPSAPSGWLEYVRLLAPFPLSAFAACLTGGAALPLLRTREKAPFYGFLVLTSFWAVQALTAGDFSMALMFAPVVALIFAWPAGLFLRLWIGNALGSR
jgi:hypothetical protein